MGPYWLRTEMLAFGPTLNRNSFFASPIARVATNTRTTTDGFVACLMLTIISLPPPYLLATDFPPSRSDPIFIMAENDPKPFRKASLSVAVLPLVSALPPHHRDLP